METEPADDMSDGAVAADPDAREPAGLEGRGCSCLERASAENSRVAELGSEGAKHLEPNSLNKEDIHI